MKKILNAILRHRVVAIPRQQAATYFNVGKLEIRHLPEGMHYAWSIIFELIEHYNTAPQCARHLVALTLRAKFHLPEALHDQPMAYQIQDHPTTQGRSVTLCAMVVRQNAEGDWDEAIPIALIRLELKLDESEERVVNHSRCTISSIDYNIRCKEIALDD